MLVPDRAETRKTCIDSSKGSTIEQLISEASTIIRQSSRHHQMKARDNRRSMNNKKNDLTLKEHRSHCQQTAYIKNILLWMLKRKSSVLFGECEWMLEFEIMQNRMVDFTLWHDACHSACTQMVSLHCFIFPSACCIIHKIKTSVIFSCACWTSNYFISKQWGQCSAMLNRWTERNYLFVSSKIIKCSQVA